MIDKDTLRKSLESQLELALDSFKRIHDNDNCTIEGVNVVVDSLKITNVVITKLYQEFELAEDNDKLGRLIKEADEVWEYWFED